MSGKDDVAADALSRVEKVISPLDYRALAPAKQVDEGLKATLVSPGGLQLKKVKMVEPHTKVCYDRGDTPFRDAVF